MSDRHWKLCQKYLNFGQLSTLLMKVDSGSRVWGSRGVMGMGLTHSGSLSIRGSKCSQLPDSPHGYPGSLGAVEAHAVEVYRAGGSADQREPSPAPQCCPQAVALSRRLASNASASVNQAQARVPRFGAANSWHTSERGPKRRGRVASTREGGRGSKRVEESRRGRVAVTRREGERRRVWRGVRAVDA
eukprot:3480918-Rhodomonas_salina.4